MAMLVSVAKFLLPAVMGTCLTKPPDHVSAETPQVVTQDMQIK